VARSSTKLSYDPVALLVKQNPVVLNVNPLRDDDDTISGGYALTTRSRLELIRNSCASSGSSNLSASIDRPLRNLLTLPEIIFLMSRKCVDHSENLFLTLLVWTHGDSGGYTRDSANYLTLY
jgi:hypothetical protein